jgi:hypothetical protein
MPMLPAALAMAFTLAAMPAAAVLGGDLASVQSDALRLRATRSQAAGPGYTVHVSRLADGSTVSEYADARGFVFMVGWSTRGKPRLAELLGAFDADYRRAAARALAAPGIRRQVQLAEGDLVVQAGSHLQAHVGRAYLRSHLPAGLDPAAIR